VTRRVGLDVRLLHEEERLFDEQERLFDEQEPLFDVEERLFDEQEWLLHEEERLFDEQERLLHEEERLFDEQERHFDVEVGRLLACAALAPWPAVGVSLRASLLPADLTPLPQPFQGNFVTRRTCCAAAHGAESQEVRHESCRC